MRVLPLLGKALLASLAIVFAKKIVSKMANSAPAKKLARKS